MRPRVTSLWIWRLGEGCGFIERRMFVIPSLETAYQIYPKLVKNVGFFTMMYSCELKLLWLLDNGFLSMIAKLMSSLQEWHQNDVPQNLSFKPYEPRCLCRKRCLETSQKWSCTVTSWFCDSSWFLPPLSFQIGYIVIIEPDKFRYRFHIKPLPTFPI